MKRRSINKKRLLTVVDITAPITIAIVVIISVICFSLSWTNNSHLFIVSDHIINYLAIVTFMVLGFGFILAAFYLKHEMRKWNEDMEKNARGKINFAALVLSIPFLIRSTFNLIQELFLNINGDLSDSINDDTWLAPLVYFSYIFIADILPMTLQLTTMLIVIDEEDIYPSRKQSLIDKSECKFSLPF